MKVTGYQLREALKEWKLKKELAMEGFNDSLFAFKDEDSPNPEQNMESVIEAENAIVSLQEAQLAYNLEVRFKFGEKEISLASAIKRIGGIGRVVKMWRFARSQKVSKDMYGRGRNLIREKDEEYAQKVMSDAEITSKLTEKVREENQLRAAIATANAREVDVALNPSLLLQE